MEAILAKTLNLQQWTQLLEGASETDFQTGKHALIAYHKKSRSYVLVDPVYLHKNSPYSKVSFCKISSISSKLISDARPTDGEIAVRASKILMRMSLSHREKIYVNAKMTFCSRWKICFCRYWKLLNECIYHLFHSNGLYSSTTLAKRCTRQWLVSVPVLADQGRMWAYQAKNPVPYVFSPNAKPVLEDSLAKFSSRFHSEYCTGSLLDSCKDILPNLAPERVALCAEEKRGFSLDNASSYNAFRLQLLLQQCSDHQIMALFRGLFRRSDLSSELLLDTICAIGSICEDDHSRFEKLAVDLITAAEEQKRLGLLWDFSASLPRVHQMWGPKDVEKWVKVFTRIYLAHAKKVQNCENGPLRYHDMLIQLRDHNKAFLSSALQTPGWEGYFSLEIGREFELWCRQQFVTCLLSIPPRYS